MVKERLVNVIFADDIRQEVGGKISIMGIYQTEMHLQAFPAVLPKFCAHISVYSPIDHPFSKLLIEVKRNGETIGTAEVTEDQLLSHPVDPPDEYSTRRTFHALMTFAPLQIGEPGTIWVDVATESESLTSNRLRMKQMTEDELASFGIPTS
ncbi:DUF6941 family protein [Paraburkholderia terrae]|uniref:DUF6941 family protein n=1 Tax=Paraburkholderia terrae TaxID=311230 RepID=UPI00206C39FE|nr:hypothetical protein [Paraburkholderia terrae]BDC37725.1 hypothetical protein PTKU15_10220 [Paraburkholderia terrae]